MISYISIFFPRVKCLMWKRLQPIDKCALEAALIFKGNPFLILFICDLSCSSWNILWSSNGLKVHCTHFTHAVHFIGNRDTIQPGNHIHKHNTSKQINIFTNLTTHENINLKCCISSLHIGNIEVVHMAGAHGRDMLVVAMVCGVWSLWLWSHDSDIIIMKKG